MKWIQFVLSLLALFFANNILFWVPGQYDWFTFVAAGVAILIAGVLAWFSSKRFAEATAGTNATWKSVAMAPPAAIFLFVVLVFCGVGLVKIIAYRLN